MNVYVYKTDWECFWSPERYIISPYASIWSVESYREDRFYKLILSLKPIDISLAKSEYCRPFLKLLGIFDTEKHLRWERKLNDNIITSFRILLDSNDQKTEIRLHKMRTAKKETVSDAMLYLPDTEEAGIILELFGKKRFDEYSVVKESIKEINEAL